MGHGEGYEYAHDAEGGVAAQDYLGVEREYYRPVPRGLVTLRELATGRTQLISADTDGGRNDLPARRPSVNGDGSVVAFDSASPDLVTGDTNRLSDVFLRTVKDGQSG